jgi:predicted nucleic acid-binding protein
MSVERAFVDTNVLLYSFDDSAAAKKQIAVELTRRLWRSGTGCLSVQVLQEFYVNAVRNTPIPLSKSDAREVVSQLSKWRVHEPKTEDVLSAVDLHQEARISFWDAMILQSASKLGCETLYSEDLNPVRK